MGPKSLLSRFSFQLPLKSGLSAARTVREPISRPTNVAATMRRVIVKTVPFPGLFSGRANFRSGYHGAPTGRPARPVGQGLPAAVALELQLRPVPSGPTRPRAAPAAGPSRSDPWATRAGS